MLRSLGIKVFSLCIQTNSLLSLMDLDLGTSLGNLIYSRMCMIRLGLVWSLWLWKCLATVVLLLCLMSKIWPWNLSMILFFVWPTYLMWHHLHSKQYMRLLLWHVPLVIVLVGCVVVEVSYLPWLGQPCAILTRTYLYLQHTTLQDQQDKNLSVDFLLWQKMK